MKKIITKISYQVMSFVYKIRDKYLPHYEILKDAGLEPGLCVIDYGCGPGGYIKSASEIVGEKGRVYAVDINPLAIQSVKKIVTENKLSNVKTILTDCKTNLPCNSIDVVYLFDFFHELDNPEPIINEIHRILKKDSIFSLYDPMTKKNNLIIKITNKNLFRFKSMGTKVCNFIKA